MGSLQFPDTPQFIGMQRIAQWAHHDGIDTRLFGHFAACTYIERLVRFQVSLREVPTPVAVDHQTEAVIGDHDAAGRLDGPELCGKIRISILRIGRYDRHTIESFQKFEYLRPRKVFTRCRPQLMKWSTDTLR